MNNSQTKNPQSQNGICSYCNFQNDKNNVFCDNCGKPLHLSAPLPVSGFPLGGAQPYQQPLGTPTMLNDIPIQDWATYVGSFWQAYLARFFKMELRQTKINFSLSAFFIGPCYFAYRKMLPQAAFAFFVSLLSFCVSLLTILSTAGSPLLAGFSITLLDNASESASLIVTVLQVAMAFFASFWYKEKIIKDITKIRQTHVAGEAYVAALKKKGGTNIVAALCLVAVAVAVGFLAFYFFNVEIMQYYDIVKPTLSSAIG